MKAIRDYLSGNAIVCMIAMLTLAHITGSLIAAETVGDAGGPRDESSIQTGSGKQYQTTVDRKTEGTLSSDDLHQVSLLASRVVNHLNEATQSMLDENPDAARPEIEKARKLTDVIRDILPVTTVTTIVKDASGNEVYKDIDKVQDEKVPLYRGMIALEVVQPIVDAKEKALDLKGLRLQDASMIHTSVLADIGYIDRKLKRASELIDKTEEALAQLTLAQTKGIQLIVNEADSPLVEVQQALRLAERMVEEGKFEAAKENLNLAQVQLGTYRALLGKEASKVVKELEDKIAALTPKAEQVDTASKIRGFWEQVVSWFTEQPGQATVVEEKTENDDAAKTDQPDEKK